MNPFRWGPLLSAPLALLLGCDNALNTQQGYEPAQPVPFSHALHAGEHQIACLYCHSDAERSRHAGVPSPSICMNCHTQVKKDSPLLAPVRDALATGRPLEWVKVHRLPDHAFFDHANHVTAGVRCQSCHGEVETMVRMRQVETMTMGWCLSCHRGPEKLTAALDPRRPKSPGAGPLQPPTDCASCHR
ncbi:MAG: cytochrome c3 family protein [Myxococcales bacterium]